MIARQEVARWGALGSRFAVGGVLAVSGFLKLMGSREELSLVIESYRLIPVEAAMTAAGILPWVEYIAGVFLVAGFWTRASAAAAAGLFAMFAAATGAAWVRGLPLAECGCFGRGGPHLGVAAAAALDAFLLALSVWAFRRGGEFLALDSRYAAPKG